MSNLTCLCESHHLAHHAGSLVITGELPDLVFTRSPNNEFKRATRAVDTASALRDLGFKPHEVKAAVAATRTHMGREDMPIETWIKIALSHCPKPT